MDSSIFLTTSNVTGRHRGLMRKRTFICRYVAPPGECYYSTLLVVIRYALRYIASHTLLCCQQSSLSSVVLRAFSALCVYSMFGHHPHPLGYLCAKFCFFHGFHCSASTWRKIAYSINHSITQLFDAWGTEAFVWNIKYGKKVVSKVDF